MQLFILASLLASASARSLILESVPALPDGWAKAPSAVAPSDDKINFSIALRNPRADEIAAAPGAKHLTRDEVRRLRAPDQADVDKVLSWLKEHGITNANVKDDFVHVESSIAQASKALEADLQRYSFKNDKTFVRATEYSIPEELKEAVNFVHPIANFMIPDRSEKMHPVSSGRKHPAGQESAAMAADGGAVCSGGVTPSCLRKLYNIQYEAPNNSSDVRFAISGYLEENGNHRDTQSFFSKYDPSLRGYDFKIETVNGGEDPQTPAGGEAQLDIEYGMAIGHPAKVTYYATGGRGVKLGDDGKPVSNPDNEPYLAFINYLLDKPDNEVPHVLSVSYGDDELTVPKDYAKKVCDMYGLLTKRGTTIIHSSGDGGSTGGQPGNCKSKDGKHTDTTMATFPAGCPWVTGLGATSHTSEPPPGVGFSSGGFSRYFSRPSWQDAAATAYIKGLNGHLDGYYDPNGRGIPDISAVGTNFACVVNGYSQGISGTSASAPLFAGLIALVNDARLRQGKQSLGFLNDKLYSPEVTSVLQDITTGTSYGCRFQSGSQSGWAAAKGWDAITGLGVPKDFQKFMAVLVDM